VRDDPQSALSSGILRTTTWTMATRFDGNTIPGTVHLVDLEHTLHSRHTGSGGDIVLVPIPSTDPDDPLNWTSRRKLTATICSSL
jgi:hypothetical protein